MNVMLICEWLSNLDQIFFSFRKGRTKMYTKQKINDIQDNLIIQEFNKYIPSKFEIFSGMKLFTQS